MAGIAAGEGNNAEGIAGMNWGSPVYICRTLDASGNGSVAPTSPTRSRRSSTSRVADGLKAVINYSGGGAPNQPSATPASTRATTA